MQWGANKAEHQKFQIYSHSNESQGEENQVVTKQNKIHKEKKRLFATNYLKTPRT